MATVEEYLAAAKKAEAAGDVETAKRLRAKAGVKEAPTPEAYREAAKRARDAGDTAAADRLEAKAGPVGPQEDYPGQVPPRVEDQVKGDSPKVKRADRFGDTTSKVTAPVWDATKAFAGGVMGGDSPSRAAIDADPILTDLPEWLKTAGGYVGDVGGTALGALGTGISGAVGMAAEAVPFAGQKMEEDLAEGALFYGQFAAPEFFGVSSATLGVGGKARLAAKAPDAKQSRALTDLSQTWKDVTAADKRGIPVMRSDVKPPTTALGKTVQRGVEGIPFAGTGGMRARQFEARIDAVRDFIGEYGGDAIADAATDVTEAFMKKRTEFLKKETGRKSRVITAGAGRGVVPMPKAIAAIDAQIAGLKAQGMAALEPVIKTLDDFRAGLTSKSLDIIEKNRAEVGKSFADPSLGSIRDAGQKALSAVYGPLREDMGNFIRGKLGTKAYDTWKAANAALAESASELKIAGMKRLLTTGEETPENIRSMLFSLKPSEVSRLYDNLPPEGLKAARTAIVQEAIKKSTSDGDLSTLSADRFKNAMAKLGPQIRTFFKGDDFEAADGLVRALRLTEHSSKAVASPLTGVQNLSAIMGAGLVTVAGTASLPVAGGIGAAVRLYESGAVRRALKGLAASKPGSLDEARAAKRLDTVIMDATEAAPVAAGQADDDYDQLYRRY